jgi:hypothetical protein
METRIGMTELAVDGHYFYFQFTAWAAARL